jgi:hypothetical protein
MFAGELREGSPSREVIARFVQALVGATLAKERRGVAYP